VDQVRKIFHLGNNVKEKFWIVSLKKEIQAYDDEDTVTFPAGYTFWCRINQDCHNMTDYTIGVLHPQRPNIFIFIDLTEKECKELLKSIRDQNNKIRTVVETSYFIKHVNTTGKGFKYKYGKK